MRLPFSRGHTDSSLIDVAQLKAQLSEETFQI